MGKVAFVTGWNGISGSAVARHLVQLMPTSDWSEVIVTSRRTPQNHPELPYVKFIALDFTKSVEELAQAMQPVCQQVTHAFFSSYVHRNQFEDLQAANKGLFQNFFSALAATAPKLEHVTLQTGGKHYNLHLQSLPTPVREDDPPQQVHLENFYHQQESYMREKCAELTRAGRPVSWNVMRPQAIIGSAHTPNGMNTALTLSIYFRLCAYMDIQAPMPTNKIYWEGTDDVSSSALIADLTVFAATNRQCSNEAFNIVNGDHFVWKYMWPRLAGHFGASATTSQRFVPLETDLGNGNEPQTKVHQEFSLEEWSKDKRDIWRKMCDELNCPGAKDTFDYGTWKFQDWVFQRTWNATLSINKARKYGWKGHVDSFDNFIQTFREFEQHGLIPPSMAK